jgi:hypothetical protein
MRAAAWKGSLHLDSRAAESPGHGNWISLESLTERHGRRSRPEVNAGGERPYSRSYLFRPLERDARLGMRAFESLAAHNYQTALKSTSSTDELGWGRPIMHAILLPLFAS